VDTDAFARYHEGMDLGFWDNLITVTGQGRYYHDLGEQRLWAGVAAGTVTTSLPLPAYWAPDGGEPSLWFFPWGFTSLYGGVRGGAELAGGLEVLLEANFGQERWSGLFMQEQGLELGYAFDSGLSVNLVLDRVSRHIIVPVVDEKPYEPMVEVADERISASLGVGAAF
jgi:hypothetical protein